MVKGRASSPPGQLGRPQMTRTERIEALMERVESRARRIACKRGVPQGDTHYITRRWRRLFNLLKREAMLTYANAAVRS